MGEEKDGEKTSLRSGLVIASFIKYVLSFIFLALFLSALFPKVIFFKMDHKTVLFAHLWCYLLFIYFLSGMGTNVPLKEVLNCCNFI